MVSFSLFSFSYPQNLRKSLLNTPATTTDEKCDLLRARYYKKRVDQDINVADVLVLPKECVAT